MSITGALNSAMSGLRAAARGSELTSSNIANALTPGFGRRSLELSTLAIGSGGVRIDAVNRHSDAGLISDRRLADASSAHAQTTSDFFARLSNSIGTPDTAGSLSARLTAVETSLMSAASRPDAPERLEQVVGDARALAQSFGTVSEQIQDSRTQADRDIARDIDTLNTALQQVKELNTQIRTRGFKGGSAAALIDERQRVVDQIGELVSVRTVPRDNGQIAIYSEGGAVLLDGSAARIEFAGANVVTPYQTLADGTLSGISINGFDVKTGALGGGRIGANFAVRDEHGVAAQAELDAMARDLMTRFENPALDPTTAPGDPGLFTDEGAAFDPAKEVGLASRLALNAAIDPQAGGIVTRVRDGLGAATPGPVGDATLLNAFSAALSARDAPASGSFAGASLSAFDLLSNIGGALSQQAARADATLSFEVARQSELAQLELAQGVDTDTELGNLLVLEQAYAANARVIQAADDMLDTLMRL
ncbi:flagellar hook-associated protein FlgK [Sulfitobacter sp. S190]|uniref:flagellar hook-associated protein FlgK n=1 Tax=Sulfitobacter sp. S190 TaxID=2867022 RepID=UPI0021A8B05B|nr:flagellar hook-associated protein FlgK [Sulfitobacter sp. S190]UWR22351.1 flagellar hook-associated protein FlgK [Sulfitobacter sp. S190]